MTYIPQSSESKNITSIVRLESILVVSAAYILNRSSCFVADVENKLTFI